MIQQNAESNAPEEFVFGQTKQSDSISQESLCSEEKNSWIGKSVSDLIQEFDTYCQRTENEETKQMIEMMQYRLIEMLCANGFSPIENETVFDVLRHTPIPFAIIPNGTPIKEFKRIGFTYGNVVVLKAIVTV